MPEGDTLHRAAAGLAPHLVGRRVVRFESSAARGARHGAELAGRRIESVEARGKHLLIGFEGDVVLRTHLRMTGSWHLYRPGERWKKPRRLARVILATDDAVAVCFNAPDVELLAGARARHGGAAGDVGPDLLADEFDAAAVAERWAGAPEMPVGVAVMRQFLAAGIGNVYKSEVLFLCRIDPFRRVADLSREDLVNIARTARREMRANLGPNARSTRNALDGGRYWVYGRSGRACYVCGSRVAMKRQGEDGRSTYYCSTCQGEGAGPLATPARRPRAERLTGSGQARGEPDADDD